MPANGLSASGGVDTQPSPPGTTDLTANDFESAAQVVSVFRAGLPLKSHSPHPEGIPIGDQRHAALRIRRLLGSDSAGRMDRARELGWPQAIQTRYHSAQALSRRRYSVSFPQLQPDACIE